MRLSFIGIGALIAWLALPSSARAENMQTTSSLAAGRLALGLEFQAGLVSGTPIEMNLHEMVGLAGGVDLYARQGIGLSDQPFYLGVGVKWTLQTGRRDRPGIAVLAGGHYFIDHYGGADVTLLLDFTVGRATPFVALDANLDFPDDVDLKLGLLGGVRIALVKNVAWFVEAGVGLTGSPRPHFVSTGPKITI